MRMQDLLIPNRKNKQSKQKKENKKKEEKMNKLFKFASVSALALITANSDVFAAAGTYAPSCSPNEVTIRFYGMEAPTSGTTPVLAKDIGSATYKNGKWYKAGTSTAVTKFGELGITIPAISKSISLNNINATNGAVAFRADLKGSVPTAVDTKSLIGSTTCASSAPANSLGVLADDTLPTLDASTVGNHTSLSYVLIYAANCANEQNATCEKVLGTKKVTYKNACLQGYGNPNFLNNVMCAEDAVSPALPANPEVPSI